MQTEGESRPMAFSQVFHLAPVNNSWVVTNGEQICETYALCAIAIILYSNWNAYAVCRYLPAELWIEDAHT